jgi:hypothetical protein
MTRIVSWAAVVGLAAVAWGADVVVEPTAPGDRVPLWPAYDDERELKWDSGARKWWLCWFYSSNTWVGNDFDVSTISAYRGVKAIRVLSTPEWPNEAWDGFRFGIYDFTGAAPGSLIWPTWSGGFFYKFTGEEGWKDVPVDWVLPRGVTAFVAAMEQAYNYPNADPHALDDNPTFVGHSWTCMRGEWRPYEMAGLYPYRNVMMRVVVSNVLAVTPTSLGRVKALYY